MDVAYQKQWLVLAAYLGLTLIMTAPLAGRLTSHVAGTGGDPWQTMWRFEEKAQLAREAALAPGRDARLGNEFFGQGEPRLVNLSVWPWMFLQLLLAQPLAYNLVWLLSFVLSGYGVYWLVKFLLSGGVLSPAGQPAEWAAFLAGGYYMFLPYRVAHSMGHFGAMQTQWLPLTILLGLAWFKRPGIGKTLGLAALLAVQAWSEHHYALWLVLFILLALAFNWRRAANFCAVKKSKAYLAVLSALLLFFVILPYWPTVRMALDSRGGLDPGREQVVRFSADLFSFVVPAVFHTAWGGAAAVLAGNFTGNFTEATQYLGLLPLLLILFFYQQIPDGHKHFWAAAAVFFAVVSLGPRLHVLGAVTGLPLPYELVNGWPVFSSVRAVARAGVLTGLSTAVLLGLVLSVQLRRRQGAAAIAAVLLAEFLFFPVPLQSARLPRVYETVKEAPGNWLIEIPAATNYTAASRALYASRRHGKGTVGNIALERAGRPENFEEIHSLPALRQLLYLRTGTLLEDSPEFFGQEMAETLPDVMRYLDAPLVLVHTDSVSSPQLRAVKRLLEVEMSLEPRRYNDALLYELGPKAGGDGVFLARDDRWQHVGFDARRGSFFGEVKQEASLIMYNVGESSSTVQMSFKVPPESPSQPQLILEGERLTLSPRLDGRMAVRLELKPGKTQLIVSSPDRQKAILQNPAFKVF